jgi:hypothetical protein
MRRTGLTSAIGRARAARCWFGVQRRARSGASEEADVVMVGAGVAGTVGRGGSMRREVLLVFQSASDEPLSKTKKSCGVAGVKAQE